MDESELRARLAVGEAAPEQIAAPLRSADAADLVDGPVRPAAVLVPLITGPAPGVLLTKRHAGLSEHAGQVSFPGGRVEPTDANPQAAALREAQEEIGLHPTQVEILRTLPDYVTGTGYRIIPVVGLVPPGLSYTPAPDEVDAVFELPMAVLMDPMAPQKHGAQFRGRWREFWVWPHPDHYIWGATAAILVHLAHLLRGEG